MIEKQVKFEEKKVKTKNGIAMLLLNLFLMTISIVLVIFAGVKLSNAKTIYDTMYIALIIVSCIYLCIICPILFMGLKVINPNEALVLTLFGNYHGTLKEEGFYWVNPFTSGFNPTRESAATSGSNLQISLGGISNSGTNASQANNTYRSKKISLKTMTLDNGKQKVNDALGNPIEIGVVVLWRVTNATKAVFNVDNFMEYLSIQSDSAIRDVTRLYAYDITDGQDEMSLRGSSQMVAAKLKEELQQRVNIAGIEIADARIAHLAYATEIAAIMLQRQQAAAIIDARKMIVDGAVGMVEMALSRLDENGTVELDDERKAAMVSNLLVVLCGNKDAQPIVNSGSIY